jgi:hypothetical protein
MKVKLEEGDAVLTVELTRQDIKDLNWLLYLGKESANKTKTEFLTKERANEMYVLFLLAGVSS